MTGTKIMATKRLVHRMADNAGLSIETHRFTGRGINASKLRYYIFDSRDRLHTHALFIARGAENTVAFIAGWTHGRNRELIK